MSMAAVSATPSSARWWWSAVFLAEVGPRSKTAAAVRFCAKLLTGLPSILAGAFAYAVVVMTVGISAPAGGIALGLLMLPTVMLTAEDAIRMVPQRMKEAAIGMGCTPTQVVLRVLLAVARAAGETAPLIFTIRFSSGWLYSHGHLDLMRPTASLAVLIYNFSGSPFTNQIELAWTAALVLVVLVLMLNIGGQFFSRRSITR
jgi:phosphate transport system permease protein